MKTYQKWGAVVTALFMATQSFALFIPGVEVPPLLEDSPEEEVQFKGEFVVKPRWRGKNSDTPKLNIRSHRIFRGVLFFEQDVDLDLIEDFYLESPFDDSVPMYVKEKDVNKDGINDLVCYFFVREVFPEDAEIENGEMFELSMNILYDGTLFSFSDEVIAKVPRKQSKKRFWWSSWKR